MKKLNLLLIIVAMFAVSCASSAQVNKVTDQFEVGNFNKIKSEAVANIVIKQSRTTSVTAEGSEKLLNILNVKMDGNTLKFSMKEKSLRKKRLNDEKLTIFVNTPNLEKIESDGVGNISIEGTFNTPSMVIESDGVGNITADNLVSGYLEVESDGVGNITLSGKADKIDISSDGVGNIDMKGLRAVDAKVESDGVGNISVYVTGTLYAESDGIGNIVYYGNPKEKSIHKDGIGKIRAGK